MIFGKIVDIWYIDNFKINRAMKKLLILLSISTLIFWSCTKDVDFDFAPTEKKSFSEIDVKPNFDWKTTIDYKFNVKGYANSIMKITSDNGQKIYHSIMLKQDANIGFNISLPAYEKTVRLKYMGQDIKIDLIGRNINYSFN